jgi:predicted PurR-regulated permease PerM
MDEQRAPEPLVPPEAASPEAASTEGSVEPAEPTDRSTWPIPSGKEPGAIAAAGTTPPGMRAVFRPAQSPSRPFLIALLLGIMSTVVFVLSAGALFVFGVGVALAFFLVPVVGWLVRHGWPRWLAAIAVVAVTLLGALIVILTVVIIVVEQGIVFMENLPTFLEDLSAWYASLNLPAEVRSAVDAIIASAQDNAAAVDEATVTSGVLGSALSLLGGLFAWFLLPFFLFYLLKDQPRMSMTFYERVPEPWKDDVSRILTITVGNVAQYFKAEFLVGSMMFGIITVGMVVIGVATDSQLLIDFAILLGLVAFVMELIPQIGPIISYIPALILALASGPAAIVAVSVYYFIAFNIEGSILVPTFQGKMINFTGATVLVLIAIGFALGGIIGAIVALPLASIVRDLFRLFFDKAVEQDLVMVPVTASLPDPGQLTSGAAPADP